MSGQNPAASRKTWNNRWTFMLAAAGSAIGLGNIWKFPYIAGQYGGGAFVMVYLLCIALVGVPLLMAETAIGRSTRLSPLNAMRKLTSDAGVFRGWEVIGWMGMLTGFIILTFYSVVAGWALSYAWDLLTGVFTGMNADQVGGEFEALTASAPRQILWHTLFMAITVFITARGVHKGLEKGLQVMMPTLFVLLFVMLGYSMLATGEFMRGFHFMFDVDFSKITGEAVVAAMGQAFFTLSLGMCALMAYGAYMPANNSIPRTALNVAFLDTLMAIISGLIVFPIVYAHGLEPSAGPGLLFVSLTSAFANMTGGAILGFMFFALVGIAALSSAISLIEPSLAWVTERFGINRVLATCMIGGAIWLVGLGSVFSFNIWADVKFFDKTIFDLAGYMTDVFLLPLGGALTAIFAGWMLKRSVMSNELAMSVGMFNVWRFAIRIIVPAAVALILYTALK
ncbi:sodium-dependent transporter [Endozoicomonas numazuensis]|uniref:Transporter n=1 Tax=Endozoicomonas numazuensis TaxID=1137799 RepID=A0A081NEP7_9GAMM|nr:sodium-dependent transporter [Endozoicomonas numazuensis]KEQ16920.1 transporter [Endozoicomonas numazuensis]